MRRMMLTAATVLLVSGSAQAEIVLTNPAVPYTQNFDTLPTTTVAGNWTNDTTLSGWFAFRAAQGGSVTASTQINAWTGSTPGALYSFFTPTQPDKALGTLASGTTGAHTFSLVILNSTGQDLTGFNLDYRGEQWRDGNVAVQSLTFEYAVFASFNPVTAATAIGAISAPGFTAVPGLNFDSPVHAGANVALDGNLAPNFVSISSSVSAAWPDGSYLVMRWTDVDDAGNDHALGIDDLTFTAVPTPGTAALLGLAGLLCGRRRRGGAGAAAV
jgi:hypothetical protein